VGVKEPIGRELRSGIQSIKDVLELTEVVSDGIDVSFFELGVQICLVADEIENVGDPLARIEEIRSGGDEFQARYFGARYVKVGQSLQAWFASVLHDERGKMLKDQRRAPSRTHMGKPCQK
jgi:hypothetical protein